MKIGRLVFKEWAAKKPLSISASGAFLKASEIVGVRSLTLGSLHALSREHKLKLTLERYKFEPDFRLAVLGIGVLTKDEILGHIQAQTEFGQLAVSAEMDYCNELIGALGTQELPAWPGAPKLAAQTAPDWILQKKAIQLRIQTQAVFCENTTDPVTASFATYRIANVHPAFAARGFAVKALCGREDARANFLPLAKSPQTGFISGIGHGGYTYYTGDAFNRILEVGAYDPAEVSGKTVHLLSCQTAGKLGPDVISKGAKCFLGYDQNFTFVWDNAATPVNEAQLFMKADSCLDITMASGGTAQAAYDATVQSFNAGMSQVPNTSAAVWLKYDRDHLKLLGNGATAVSPDRYIQVSYPLQEAQQQAIALAGQLLTT